MNKVFFFGLGVMLTLGTNTSSAKARFYTLRDVYCSVENVCRLKAGDMPLNGELRTYYADGTLRSAEEYRNGVRDGKYNHFSGRGKLLKSAYYRDGKENGNVKTFYESGNLKKEYEKTDGVLNGKLRTYYQDGQIRLENEYRDGKKDGTENAYYENSKIKYRVNFVKGTPVSGYCFAIDGQKRNFLNGFEMFLNSGQTPCAE